MRLLVLAVLLDVMTTVAGLAMGLGEAGLLTRVIYTELGLVLGSIAHYTIEYMGFMLLCRLTLRLRPDLEPGLAVLLAAVYPCLAFGHNLGVLLRVSSV